MEQAKTPTQLPLPLPLRILRASFPFLQSFLPWMAKGIAVKFFLKPFRYRIPDREKEMDAKAQRQTLRVEGIPIEVYTWGEKGPYVLCVHGWSGRGTQFYAIAEMLLSNGFRVATFDAPAHGRSPGERTNLVEFAQCINAVVQSEKSDPVVLIGHSLGGVASMLYQTEYGKQIPQVTINSPVMEDEIIENYALRINAKAHRVKGWLNDYVKEKIGKNFYEVTGEYLAESFPKVPFLICHDKDDREASIRNLHRLHEKLPLSETFETEGFGHVRLLRADPLLDRLKQFTKGLG